MPPLRLICSADDRPSPPLPPDGSHEVVDADGSEEYISRDVVLRKRISVACTECRRRKSKCRGRPLPCDNCRMNRFKCIVDHSLDGRRKASIRRLEAELHQYRVLHGYLFRIFRSIKVPDNYSHLIELYRRNAPVEELVRYLQQQPDQNRQHQSLSQTLKHEGTRLLSPTLDVAHEMIGYHGSFGDPAGPIEGNTAQFGVLHPGEAGSLEQQRPPDRFRPHCPPHASDESYFLRTSQDHQTSSMAKNFDSSRSYPEQHIQRRFSPRVVEDYPQVRSASDFTLNSMDHGAWLIMEGLSKALQDHPALFTEFTEMLDDHVAVSATLFGWGKVKKEVCLDPQWAFLETWDRQFLAHLDPIDRLAGIRYLRRAAKFRAAPDPNDPSVTDSTPAYLQEEQTRDLTSHSDVAKLIPWPPIRKMVMQNPTRYSSDEFYSGIKNAYRIAWPYRFADAYSLDPDSGLYCLNPSYTEVCMDIENWALSSAFLDMFPEFRGLVVEHDEELRRQAGAFSINEPDPSTSTTMKYENDESFQWKGG